MRHIPIIRTSAMAVCLVLSLAVMAHAAATATVLKSSGQVEAQKSGAGAWKALKKGDKLAQGDKIKTGAGGEAVIEWFNGNAVKIKGMSLVTLDELSADARGEKSTVEIQQGKAHIKAKKLSAGSSFDLKTPVARAGVRGTEFSVELQDDGTAVFAVIEGSIFVEAIDITKTLDADYYVIVQTSQAPGEPMTIPDDMMQELNTDAAEISQLLAQAQEASETAVPDNVFEELGEVADELADIVLQLDMEYLLIENIASPVSSCCDY